jgi:hypothetical protein
LNNTRGPKPANAWPRSGSRRGPISPETRLRSDNPGGAWTGRRPASQPSALPAATPDAGIPRPYRRPGRRPPGPTPRRQGGRHPAPGATTPRGAGARRVETVARGRRPQVLCRALPRAGGRGEGAVGRAAAAELAPDISAGRSTAAERWQVGPGGLNSRQIACGLEI